MFHRPTLIPNAMKTTCKNATSAQSTPVAECPLSPLINNEELVVVEPTDPDEDRLKELQQSGQQPPTLLNEVSIDSIASNTVPMKMQAMTDSPRTSTPTIPLSDALQSLFSTALRSSLSVPNEPMPSVFSNRVPNRTRPSIVSNAVPKLWLQPPVAPNTSSAMTVPLTIESTLAMQNTAATSAASSTLHPLAAALLVNCATVNLITQLLGSLGLPTYLSPSLEPTGGVNPTPNLINLISALFPNLAAECLTSQQVENTLTTNPHPPATEITSTSSSGHIPTVTGNNEIGSHHTTTASTATCLATDESDRSINIVHSLLNEAKTAIEASKYSTGSTTKMSGRVKRFKCPMPNCHLAFYSRFNQTEHIRTHTGERPFTCTIPECAAAFKRRRDLRDHLNVHTVFPPSARDPSGLSNPEDIVVPSRMEAQQPYVMSATSPSSIADVNHPTCCTKDAVRETVMEVDQSASITKHCASVEECEQDASLQCTRLHTSTRESQNGGTNMKDVNDSETAVRAGRRHICPYANCGKAYAKLNKLKEHLRSHTGERPYVCREPGCGAAFIRLYGVRRHELTHVFGRKRVARVTQSIPGFSDGAGMNTSEDSNHDTSEHSSTHSSSMKSISPSVSSSTKTQTLIRNMEPPLPSPNGEEELSGTDNKSDSIRLALTTNKRVLPVIAPKTPVQPALRPLSPISGSPGIRRPHICPFKECGKAFPKLNKLREHICRHTGERPFVCDKCHASFVRMYDLRRHGKIHLRAPDMRSERRPLAPRPFNCESDSGRALNQEPDSTVLC